MLWLIHCVHAECVPLMVSNAQSPELQLCTLAYVVGIELFGGSFCPVAASCDASRAVQIIRSVFGISIRVVVHACIDLSSCPFSTNGRRVTFDFTDNIAYNKLITDIFEWVNHHRSSR